METFGILTMMVSVLLTISQASEATGGLIYISHNDGARVTHLELGVGSTVGDLRTAVGGGRLVFAGKPLYDDARTLAEMKITSGSVVEHVTYPKKTMGDIVIRLTLMNTVGCPPKRMAIGALNAADFANQVRVKISEILKQEYHGIVELRDLGTLRGNSKSHLVDCGFQIEDEQEIYRLLGTGDGAPVEGRWWVFISKKSKAY